MVSRSTSRQAEILSVITADPEQDLYQISAHGTTCALCAPYEGRVYSRSGKDPDFPPLSDAFALPVLSKPLGTALFFVAVGFDLCFGARVAAVGVRLGAGKAPLKRTRCRQHRVFLYPFFGGDAP